MRVAWGYAPAVLGRRPDADLVRDAPPYRRMMPLLMRARNESAVYFEQRIDATCALARLEAERARGKQLTFLHLVLHALGQMFAERPRLNRFVSGGRLWQRRGIWVSFSAKKAFRDDAPIVVVKRRLDPAQPLDEMVAELSGELDEARSDRQSPTDKEVSLLLRLPHFLLSLAIGLSRWLDSHGLLPLAMLRHDPFYASVFVANLGSLKIDAAYHHLYEYGPIPLFLTIGRFEDAVVAGPDGPAVQKRVVLKWSFDERTEDGLYCAAALEILRRRLEDPAIIGTVGAAG